MGCRFLFGVLPELVLLTVGFFLLFSCSCTLLWLRCKVIFVSALLCLPQPRSCIDKVGKLSVISVFLVSYTFLQPGVLGR